MRNDYEVWQVGGRYYIHGGHEIWDQLENPHQSFHVKSNT